MLALSTEMVCRTMTRDVGEQLGIRASSSLLPLDRQLDSSDLFGFVARRPSWDVMVGPCLLTSLAKYGRCNADSFLISLQLALSMLLYYDQLLSRLAP
jgi:hypothetical protein